MSVCPSVSRPSVCFSFPDDKSKFGICIDIVEIWFGIAVELSAQDTPIFSFPDDNLSKCQWIFTNLCMCIDIVEIRIGIANGQISSNFDGVICLRHTPIFSFLDDNLSKCQGILTKVGTCIDIKEIWFGLLLGKFCQCLTELSARNTIMAEYYNLTFLFNTYLRVRPFNSIHPHPQFM